MRRIDPKLFNDELIGKLPPEFRLLWIGLVISIVDDQGRALDNPTLIRGTIFPYDRIDDEVIDNGLAVFSEAGKLIRYAAGTNGDGRRLLQVVKWWDYQGTAIWMTKSAYPAPPHWVDRIRSHEGHSVIMVNWDKVGGPQPKGGQKRQAKHAAKAGPTPALSRGSTGAAQAIDDDDVNDDVNADGDKGSASRLFFEKGPARK